MFTSPLLSMQISMWQPDEVLLSRESLLLLDEFFLAIFSLMCVSLAGAEIAWQDIFSGRASEKSVALFWRFFR